MNPEALILRRCYPVPVIFADLRRACHAMREGWFRGNELDRTAWSAELKEVTSAIDEVYAVVDGREVRVAIVSNGHTFKAVGDLDKFGRVLVDSLLAVADEQGYWERPHEVRLDLSQKPVTHDEVARAVLVGQEYAERHA